MGIEGFNLKEVSKKELLIEIGAFLCLVIGYYWITQAIVLTLSLTVLLLVVSIVYHHNITSSILKKCQMIILLILSVVAVLLMVLILVIGYNPMLKTSQADVFIKSQIALYIVVLYTYMLVGGKYLDYVKTRFKMFVSKIIYGISFLILCGIFCLNILIVQHEETLVISRYFLNHLNYLYAAIGMMLVAMIDTLATHEDYEHKKSIK